jgi:hypothetical protein
MYSTQHNVIKFVSKLRQVGCFRHVLQFLTELECPEFYIKCDDGLQCIKEENLCDFGIHCNDLSDENHEKCASKYIVLITVKVYHVSLLPAQNSYPEQIYQGG